MSDKIIDNTGLFDREDDTPQQDDSNPPNDGPVDQKPEDVENAFQITLLAKVDGSVAVEVDGTPSLVDMQVLVYRALKGIETRIQSETTVAMMMNAMGAMSGPR